MRMRSIPWLPYLRQEMTISHSNCDLTMTKIWCFHIMIFTFFWNQYFCCFFTFFVKITPKLILFAAFCIKNSINQLQNIVFCIVLKCVRDDFLGHQIVLVSYQKLKHVVAGVFIDFLNPMLHLKCLIIFVLFLDRVENQK